MTMGLSVAMAGRSNLVWSMVFSIDLVRSEDVLESALSRQ